MGALAFPTYHFDLRTDGSAQQITLTPTTADVSGTFTMQGVSGIIGDAFKRVAAIAGRVTLNFDQAASGGAAINWDDLPRAITGVEINSPQFGILQSKEASSGPVLKHMIEYIGQGYRYGDAARAQIAAADGDTAVHLYWAVPFVQQCLVRPHDTSPWVGWMDRTQVTVSIAATTVFDALSTGAVLESTAVVNAWCEYFVDNDLEIPTLAHWELYQRAAAGATGLLIEGMGSPRNLRNVEEFDRLAGLFWHMDQKGFGGPDGADNVTELLIPTFGIDRSTNIDAYFRRFRTYAQRTNPHVGGNGTSALHDSAGGYESLAAAVNTTMNSATAFYIPIIAPSPEMEITKLPKVGGDVDITARFTSTPSSGMHKFTAYSFRQINAQGRKELLQRAGRPGAEVRVELADGNSLQNVADFRRGGDPLKYNNPRRFLGLPTTVVKEG